MAMKTKVLCTLIAALLYLSSSLYAATETTIQPSKAYTTITREGLNRRQLAQYDFLQRHLEPDILEENQVIKQLRLWFKTGVIYGTTAAIAYGIAWLIWQLPIIQNDIQNIDKIVDITKRKISLAKFAQEKAAGWNAHLRMYNPQLSCTGPSDKDIRNLTDMLSTKEQELTEFGTLFWTMHSILFAFLRPFVRNIIDDYLPDNPFSYAQILTEFIKHWHEYKVCTPKEFHYEFDILRLCAQITNNKLEIDESIAELIITAIVMQVIDITVNNESSD